MARTHRSRRDATRREIALALLLAAGLGLVASNRREAPVTEPPLLSVASRAAGPGIDFGLCHTGGGENCVVDGDTFWIAGEKVRIADIDAPETHPPRCAAEAALGKRATARLRDLLSAGPVTLGPADRPTDRHGRRLAIAYAGGVGVGETLIAEGLARPWGGRRRPWCDQP